MLYMLVLESPIFIEIAKNNSEIYSLKFYILSLFLEQISTLHLTAHEKFPTWYQVENLKD